MGKSDENQTKKSVHRAADSSESKHNDGESNNNNKPGFDTLGIISLDATFENNKIDLLRHSRWRDTFRQLCEYKVQFGHCRVPVRYSVNPQLGAWARSQRNIYRLYQEEKPTSMTAERIRALDAIGFDWGVRRTERPAIIWSERFRQLCEFKAQFGHCYVPVSYPVNPKLGTWVKNQRNRYRLYQEEKPTPMTAERFQQLEVIGFDCRERETHLASMWSERLGQLCAFQVQFGHCRVPAKYSANPKLGEWVRYQRNLYRLYHEEKPTSMTAERFQQLDAIGFDWGGRRGDLASMWSERVGQLCAFQVQFGHCRVPARYSANRSLGRWVHYQRNRYRLYQEEKSTSMTAEHIRELNGMGFVWDPNAAS
jgi:hypothetical protein